MPEVRFPIVERFKSFTCTNEDCDFTIWKTIAGRLLSRDEFETLVRDKQTEPLGGFRSKKGKRFHAALKLSDDFKAEFDFGPNGQENGAAQPVDFSRQEASGNMSEMRRTGIRIRNDLRAAKIQSARTRPATSDLAKSFCNDQSSENR